jgi:hypothetical protein
VGAELFQADGRTDSERERERYIYIHDDVNSLFFFCNFAKAPKNCNFSYWFCMGMRLCLTKTEELRLRAFEYCALRKGLCLWAMMKQETAEDCIMRSFITFSPHQIQVSFGLSRQVE